MTFAINSTAYERVVNVQWQDVKEGEYLSGPGSRNRWRRLTASTEAMETGEYAGLFALEGQRVTVTAPHYDDRNADTWRTYLTAELKRVEAAHIGPSVQQVSLEFLVRL